MRLRLLKILFFVLWPFLLTAQKEANYWYFGQRAGLNFNSGAPVADTNGKKHIIKNGGQHCATISDKNGNLLFYTQGDTVWNKTHNIMVNGTGILAGGAESDVLIVPLPGQKNIYYIFTSHLQLPLYNHVMHYTIVDINKNSGLGEVISKNNFLLYNSIGALTAVRHSNGRSVWIIAHQYNNNHFYTYLLKPGGLDTIPVISSAGNVFSGLYASGVMKNSPDGRFLTVGGGPDGFTELYHFNNSSGSVNYLTNLQYLTYNISGYTIEYSPDGLKLYVGGNYHPVQNVYITLFMQYDLSLNNINLIKNSYKHINRNNDYGGCLQLGSDGKIYVTQSNQQYIGCINNPNQKDTFCNYTINSLYLGGRKGLGYFPTFMQSYFYKPDFMAEPLCFGDSSHFSLTDTSQLDSVLWNFGNPTSGINNISRLLNAAHKFTDTGNYSVNLVVYHKGIPDTTFREIKISYPPHASFTVNDTIQCIKGNLFTFTNNTTIQSGSMTWEWDFGDNSKYYKHDTSHSYLTTGIYNVKLVALSDYGCSDSFYKNVVVTSDPVASFTVNDTAQCLPGNSFTFTNNSIGAIKSFWNFGDGLTDTLKSPNHSYLQPDTFLVKLNIVTDQGCKDSIARSVIVHPGSVPGFGINKTVQCLNGNNFIFSDSSRIDFGSIIKHEWNLGDGNSDTNINVSHTYNKAGIYHVTLRTTVNYGCKDSVTKQIMVLPMPDANFIAYDSIQCLERNNFLFSNKSTSKNSTLTYLWNFGDSLTSTALNPNHSYSYDATFTVKLVVTDTFGCKDSADKTTKVHVHPEPLSAFAIDDSSQCLRGNHVNFSNSSIISSGTFTQLWYFGDGDTTSSFNSNHSYKGFDTFTVKLIITSDWGCKDSVLKKVYIHPQPKADFAVNDSSQCLKGNNFVFTNLSQKSKVKSQTFNWKFGDGITDTTTNPIHSYVTDSSYVVKLKAISDMGCLDSVTKTIFVNPHPKAGFSVIDSSQCLKGNNFVFKNLSQKLRVKNLTFIWKFGDGTNDTATNPIHSYLTDSAYVVNLTAISDKGCMDSVTKKMVVNPQPKADFAVNDSSQCLKGNNFVFTNLSQKSKVKSQTFTWKFGDGITDTATNPIHSYVTDSSYVVKLKAISDMGCMDSVTKTIYVNPHPKVDFVVNDTSQCLKGNSFTFTDNSSIKSGSIVQYNFDLGDGTYSTFSSVTHSYLTSDSFFVKLVAKSDQRCTDSITKIVYVRPMPKAGFTINTNPQYIAGNNFIFTNTATIPTGKLSLIWDFGDGITSTASNPKHSYLIAGSYQVVMIATSDYGCADTFTDTVFVLKNPGIVVSFTVQNACVGEEVLFRNTSVVNPPDSFLNFLWDFGDGNQTIVRNDPKHIYYSSGTYIITLVVLTAYGNRDTLIDTIEIYPSPTVNITAIPDTIAIPGRPVTLTANGLYDQLLWSDNSTGSSIIVSIEGKYWVKATFNNGCKSSDTIELTKGEYNEFEVVNVFTPNGDGINDNLFIKNIEQIQPCKFNIYNRWGNELYSSNNYQNNWDGTYKGKTLPEGTYYFVLVAKDGKVYKGAVNILK